MKSIPDVSCQTLEYLKYTLLLTYNNVGYWTVIWLMHGDIITLQEV